MNNTLLWALKNLHWKSIEKDNMEYQCTATCYVKDIIDTYIKDNDNEV